MQSQSSPVKQLLPAKDERHLSNYQDNWIELVNFK